jgi:hypothetical protein
MVPAPISWVGDRGRGLGASEPAEEPSEQEQNDRRCHPIPDATVDPVHDSLLQLCIPGTITPDPTVSTLGKVIVRGSGPSLDTDV